MHVSLPESFFLIHKPPAVVNILQLDIWDVACFFGEGLRGSVEPLVTAAIVATASAAHLVVDGIVFGLEKDVNEKSTL